MKPVDAKQLRAVFGKFATGVTVVSFEREGETFGMTVNSFTSVSLDPPMVLFCPALSCRFAEGAHIGTKFSISILAQDQKEVCLHFAGRPSLEHAPWSTRVGALPIIDGCLAYFHCELTALHLHGDHYVAVGEVQDWAVNSDESPLLFYSGHYPSISS